MHLIKNISIRLTIILFFATFNVFAEANIRKCILLPVKDNLGGALSYKVFNEVEGLLKRSDWCVYKSNSEIMNILSNHRTNIDNLIEDPEVLKVISEKTQTGSLIKISIIKEVNGVSLAMKVYGSNGEDLYFKDETQSTNDDYKVLAQIIKNWLEVFATQIPYEGKIIGVLGPQFTIDAGKNRSVLEGNNIYVVRPVTKKRHPLLKEVVDWETKKIAEAKILFSAKDQSQARIIKYESKEKIAIGDWVILKRDKDSVVEQVPFDDSDGRDFSFGKMGTMSLNFLIGKNSVTTETSGTIKKMSASSYGVNFDAELWLTRNYWASINFSKDQSTLKGREGIGSSVENDSSITSFDVLFGYKYLPLGFFNGPQVDMYTGYSQLKFGMGTLTQHGITEISFTGIALGVRGSLPLQNLIRLKAEIGLIFNPTYQELVEIYGEDDSASSYKIKFGGSYNYAPNMTLDFFYSLRSGKASFESPVRSIQGKISGVNLGATYTF